MNILVTTPKTEIDNSRKEGQQVEQEGGYWFRTFKFKPKVEPGDKIFFTENGQIRGYGIIFEIYQSAGQETCDVTGRVWGSEYGSWVVCYNDWHWLPTLIPFKGFQGIRYIDRLTDPEIKNKLNEVE